MRTFALATMVFLGLLSASFAQSANTITVPIEGLRNDNGVVRCGLYNSPNGFRDVGKQFKGEVAKISGGKATCVFSDVPPGTYAVALFHAENNEETLPTGMFGIPKLGYGFTRDAKGSMGPPSFNAAAYAYQGGSTVWPVKMNY
ncbi:MAG: DUF2141 domain-containing protein [Alphaproteobacteria bacterium]|nr:DUF2141 domain-containing protein [Alphaproteobacteria bacterium]